MMKKLLLLFLMLYCSTSFATTIFVTNTNDSGPGSLRDIMQGTTLQNGDTIRFDPSLIASGSATITTTLGIFTRKDITIIGQYNATDTLYISGGVNRNQLFYINHGNTSAPKAKLILDSLVMISAGANRGSHLYYNGDTLIVKNSIFRSGRRTAGGIYEGGSIWMSNKSNNPAIPNYFEITNCSFDDNKANLGGAIYVRFSDETILNNVTFTNNTSNEGGAIYIAGNSNITINNSSLFDNSAVNFGGAICASNHANSTSNTADITINKSSIYNNTATNGGGISCINVISDLKVNTSTLTNNIVTGEGAAISVFTNNTTFRFSDLRLSLYNSTITKNSTSTGGIGSGILVNHQFANSREFLTLDGSIIADNGTGSPLLQKNIVFSNTNSNFTTNGHNLIGDSSIRFAQLANTDKIGVTGNQLNLGLLQDNEGLTPTMLPMAGSIALNIGDTLDVSPAQNGPVTDGYRDVGAGEFYCTFSKTISPQACISYNSPSGNYTYNQTGTYFDTVSGNGCDTLYTINLSINNSSIILNETSCGDYLSPSGKTFTTSGQYFDTIANNLNCDSLITINLTVNSPTTSSLAITSCGDYTTPSGKIVSASSNFNDTIVNSVGCDSIIVIALTVNQSSSSVINPVVCKSFLSPSGQIYTTSGQYFDTIANVTGCDSAITINLTVNETFANFQINSCGSYISPSGKIITASGTINDTITNSAGCDSIMTIIVTVTNINTNITANGLTLTASHTGANYKWLNCNNNFSIVPGETSQSFTATSNGSYTCEISLNGCIDTTACYVINTVGLVSIELNESINIYPNPVINVLSIDSKYEIQEVEIYSIEGLLIEKVYNVSKINTDYISKGTYLLKVKTEQGNITKRFMKN